MSVLLTSVPPKEQNVNESDTQQELPGIVSAGGFAPKPVSTAANYESHAIDEIEKAVENIDVTGWRLLVVLPKLKEQTVGGIYLDPNQLDREKLAACIAYVAKAGPDAYKDKQKFPTGAWCQEGNWIVMKSYSGNRIKSTVADIELRIINDDSVEAVIKDPSKYTRI